MSVIKIISSTMGHANPSPVTGRKPYRWHGIPDWEPGDDRFREQPPSPRHATAEVMRARRHRLAEFTRLRAEGRTVAMAARILEVTMTTARTYEREREAALREAQAP